MEVFCFVLGILFAYTLKPLSIVILLSFIYIKPSYRLPLTFFLGMALAGTHQWLILPKGMPKLDVIPKALVSGTIDSIPTRTPFKTSFILAMDALNNKPAQARLLLTWYNKAPILHAGQRGGFEVKLKKPRNYQNPGSFDYLQSLNSKHIFWTGYIRSKTHHLIQPSTPKLSWLPIREYLATELEKLAPNRRIRGIIQALALNLTQHISPEDWELFRRTGTVHIFGISGEHIALIAGFVFFLFKRLWSLSKTLCLYIPAFYVASLTSFISALIYAFLAGFGPPVQRALIGCFFYSLCCLGKQKFTPWQVWRYALVGVLCMEPHAVFMQGFYFSFLAVACLLLTQQLWSSKGYKNILIVQLACLIGLMPLSLYWFAYGSLNGYLANLFVIPLVGLVLVPLILILLVLIPFGAAYLLIKPVTWLISLLFQFLEWTEHLSAINIEYSLPSLPLTLGLMGALLLLVMLPIKTFKYFAIFWILVACIPHRALVKPGEALIRVLDVGQGLAISVHTAEHTLLYDTGDQFFQGSNLGDLVILPYYKALGINNIDTIVISHPDKDHRGGLKSVEAGMRVKQLLVNDLKYYDHGSTCHNHPDWTWDGVRFHFFSLEALSKTQSKNNSSCVLQITTPKAKALLAGDIEKSAETYLVKTYKEQLASQVLIVPHHGSKTSSSYRFLLEVSPLYAIASLGFDNRFHFPHAQTLKNLQSLKIPFFRTDTCGMVEVLLPRTGKVKKPLCFAK